MAAQNAPASDQTELSSWIRDFRRSLALLVVGIVMVVAVSAFSLWADSSGNYPTSFGAGLAITVIGTAGGMLILLAGTVAYYHREGIRRSRRDA